MKKDADKPAELDDDELNRIDAGARKRIVGGHSWGPGESPRGPRRDGHVIQSDPGSGITAPG